MVNPRIWGAALALALTPVVVSSCSSPESLGFGQDSSPPPLVSSDGGVAEEDASSTPEQVTMCTATTCPAPLTTCSSSRFACDVNLKTDPNNCGACGVVCPGQRGNSEFACIDGECKMTCSSPTSTVHSSSYWADCNGVVDDDCETELGTNANCRFCGDACTDPEKPCIRDATGMGKGCGCDAGKVYCGGLCVDPKTTDYACGTCGNVCDSTGGGAPAITNGYYGCVGGACGAAKCQPYYADCDKNAANGCEASLADSKNCGACGVACDADQACVINATGMPECRCPLGTKLCGSTCVDLSSDPLHCGACGSLCLGLSGEHSNAVCLLGSCAAKCDEGWGDCNGDSMDGCEVNLQSDPLNCGACGTSCDLAAGQPCIAGRCLVEPCKPEEGTTK